ncbi:hypothetical protein D3C76_523650 [compost metagenome]
MRVGPGGVDGGVDHIGGGVDAVVIIRLVEHLAVEVDLVQAGSGDLLVEHAERVEQDMLGFAGHAQGDVVVDQVGHAVGVQGTVQRRQLDPGLPLGRRDRLRIGCPDFDSMDHFVHGFPVSIRSCRGRVGNPTRTSHGQKLQNG